MAGGGFGRKREKESVRVASGQTEAGNGMEKLDQLAFEDEVREKNRTDFSGVQFQGEILVDGVEMNEFCFSGAGFEKVRFTDASLGRVLPTLISGQLSLKMWI
jgi:hypothetical protein